MDGAGAELGSPKLIPRQARPELVLRRPSLSAGISVLQARLDFTTHPCHTIFWGLLAQWHSHPSSPASAPGRAPGWAVLSVSRDKSISLSELVSFLNENEKQ